MLRLNRIALIAFVLWPRSWAWAADAAASLVPSDPGAAVLISAFGADGLDLLASRGYVVLQGKGAGRRLIYVSWPTLEALAAQTEAAIKFEKIYRDFMSGNPAGVPSPSLSQLPAAGLMTPNLRLAKLLLSASHEDFSALAGSGRAAAAPGPTLFETRWGKKFAARTHADSLDDPMALAKPFFDAYLAGPSPDAEASRHFTDFISAAYQKTVAELIATDAKAGAPSEELRAWLRKYLTDQRHLYALRRNREELERLDRKKAVSRELANLFNIEAAIAKDPGLWGRLKEAMKKPLSNLRFHISSAGIHLDAPAKLGRNESGDAVAINEGFWIDGLLEGEKTEVEETTFADYGPLGLREIETHLFMRSNGGPYAAITRKIRLDLPKAFVFRSFIGGPGAATLEKSLDVPVTDDFQRAQRRLAEADHQALACDFKAAEAAYEKFASDIEAPAKEKKQYKSLRSSAQWRRRTARRNAGRLAKLEEEVNASREDSSPQKCAYNPARTESALRLARSLPAGCDKLVPELNRQLSLIQRREDDQKNFAAAAEAGEHLRRNCRFAAASEQWASALAVLDADPAARCGALEERAKSLEKELLTLRLEEHHFQAFKEDFKTAAGASDKEASLRLLRPLIARGASMPTASCFEKDVSGAMKLALVLGETQYPAPGADAATRLPEDKTLSDTSKEISDELRRMSAAVEAAKQKKSAQQTPALPEARVQAPSAAKPAAETPAPAPESAKPRLQCLEEGFKKNSATIDCNGKDFDILELKRLRQKTKSRPKGKAARKSEAGQ